MILIPLSVIWAGYTLAWFGYAMTKGQGIGFTDLIIPSRVSKVDAAIKQWGGSGDTASSAAPDPGTFNNGGVQSPFLPQTPTGPSVPPPPSGRFPSTPPATGTR